MRVHLSLIVILLFVTNIFGQEYIYFRSSISNTSDFIVEDDAILDASGNQTVSEEELNKYNNCIKAIQQKQTVTFPDISSLFYNNLPSLYRAKNQDVPEYPCAVNDSMGPRPEALVFSLNGGGKMKTFKSFSDDPDSYTFKYLDFIVREGKLYLKNKKYYEKVFDNNYAFSPVTSLFGESIYIKHYPEVTFLKKRFLDIYEYFYHFRSKAGGEIWMLLWFDKDYNLQRVLLPEGGHYRK